MAFIMPDMQAPDEKKAWLQLDANERVTLDGAQYVYRRAGMRHFLIRADDQEGRREVKTYVKAGKRFVSVINPVTLGNHVIIVADVQGAIVHASEASSVPTRAGFGIDGKFHFEILLQDVTLVRHEQLRRPVPVAFDQETARRVAWIEKEDIETQSTVLRNSRELYLDAYGSFWTTANCYDAERALGPLFEEQTKSEDGKMNSAGFFYLVRNKDGNVVPKYLPAIVSAPHKKAPEAPPVRQESSDQRAPVTSREKSPETQPSREPFGGGKHAYVTAIISVNGTLEAWIQVPLTDQKRETSRLHEGDKFQIGAFSATVTRIREREVEVEVKGKHYTVPLGDRLRVSHKDRE